MFHAGTIEGVENHRDSYFAWAEYDKNKLSIKSDHILYDSIKSKMPNLTWKKFQEMQIKDKILTAEEAVEMGLADKVE
jgi:ATP-dependent protease ClpP protease subunit